MMDAASIRAWAALPLEQRRAHGAASNGLLDGDLAPLAAYIRAGWPLDRILAEQLADAIEGPDDEGFTLRMVNRPGHRKFSDRERLVDRTLAIGLYVHGQQCESPPGAYEGIIKDAQKKFGGGRATVTDAVREFRRIMGEAGSDD